MKSHVQIDSNPTLLRDLNSKAILNTDKRGLQEYLMRKEIAKRQTDEQVCTKLRLNKIEEEMQEIKTLLKELAMSRNVNGN